MRSSDLSSDGGSSDLRLTSRRPRPSAVPDLRRVPGLVPGRAGGEHCRMRDDAADDHVGEEHRPMTDFGTPGVISAFRGPFHDGPPAEALEVVTPPLRSEAHTSELPSLMRISYAVFCVT